MSEAGSDAGEGGEVERDEAEGGNVEGHLGHIVRREEVQGKGVKVEV